MDLEDSSLRYPIVTGAGGFIGFHLVIKLAELECVETVFAVDLPGSSRLSALSKLKKVKTIQHDLRTERMAELLPVSPTIIFALAAKNGTSFFYTEPLSVLVAAALPILNTITEFAKVCPIIYSSSSEVYAGTIGNDDSLIPTNENIAVGIEDIRNSRWSYATGKLFGEMALIAAKEELGLMGAIVRYHNVYGPNMGRDHFIPDFVERAERKVYKVYGANQTRSFTYIDDAVTGTILTHKANLSDVPIFHLGNPEEIAIIDAARIIMNAMGVSSEEPISLLSPPKGSPNRRLPDVTKAKLELNWEAKVKFREGILKYLQSRKVNSENLNA